MQVGPKCQLLPPSHFTLAPPASFQLQRSQAGPPKRAVLGNDSLARAARQTEVSKALGYSDASVVSTQPSTEPVTGAGKTPTTAQGLESRGDVTCTAAETCQRRRRQMDVDACAAGTQAGLRRLSLDSRGHPREDRDDRLSNWLPETQSEAGGRRVQSISSRQHEGKSSSSRLRSTTASESYSSERRSATSNARGDRASTVASGVTDNVEEVLARSLAQCQKIDKNLEFYADIRKKWRGSSPPSTSPQNTTAIGNRSEALSSPRGSGRENTDVNKHACANPSSNQAAPSTAYSRSIRQTSKQLTAANRPVGGDYYLQKAFRSAGSVERVQTRGRPQGERYSAFGEVSRLALNDLSRRPPVHKKSTTTGESLSQSCHPSTPQPNTPRAPEKLIRSGSEVNRTGALSVPSVASQEVSEPLHLQTNHTRTIHTTPPNPLEAEEEDEFNDFDSIQQDSDSETVEPPSGTFGKPVLTGATPLLPSPSLSRTTEPSPSHPGHKCVTQGSSESEGVRKKPFTKTRNDTEIARVLQAEEESRAGTTLTPNTSSDLAIAQQIQKELDQLSDREERAIPPDPTRSAAEGRGDPDTMRSSYSYRGNITSVFCMEKDDNRYDIGYELGREFIAYDHNSPAMEQKEMNRNIPQKSVKKNNYSSHWDEGGTGIVTGCVRDMTRRQAILEREQQDLAFEGHQELEEIRSGLDSQSIGRTTHEYLYKEKHRPKAESVQPVTQCAVCLDDFHEGEPLRLLPCAHTFHRVCIDKWLEENTECAVCKEDIVGLARRMGVIVDKEKYKKKYW